MFLVSVSDVDEDTEHAKQLATTIDKAIKYAADSQSTRGGWGYITARDECKRRMNELGKKLKSAAR